MNEIGGAVDQSVYGRYRLPGLILGLGFGLLILLRCASQGFPPGGPEDKTPPEVVEVFPPGGATQVNAATKMHILFTERMEPQSLKESLFISPFFHVPPRIEVKAGRVAIQPAQDLDTNQTYVITVGAGAKDLHGNGLSSSYTCAFSTGERIDQGQISGTIRPWQGQVKDANAWAYILGRTAQPDPAADVPDYMTQADGSGRYRFAHLSPGSYRLFAFLDADRNGKYSVGHDPLGIAMVDVDLKEENVEATGCDFILAIRDTLPPECRSIQALDRFHVDLRFSEEVTQPDPDSLLIETAEKGFQKRLSVWSSYLDFLDKSVCHVVTEAQEKDVVYQVDVSHIADGSGNLTWLEASVDSFIGTDTPDTTPPVVIATLPRDSAVNVATDAGILLVFSDVLDTAEVYRSFSLVAGTGDTVPGVIEWPDPATCVFRPRQRLAGTQSFTASLEAMKIMDWEGNSLKDSATVFSFRTLDPDSAGILSGLIDDEDSLAGGPFHVVVEKAAQEGGIVQSKVSGPGPYEIDELRPGLYTVWVFQDEDTDGSYTPGRVLPIGFSERFTWYPDTVEVRSRWETRDIDMILKRR